MFLKPSECQRATRFRNFVDFFWQFLFAYVGQTHCDTELNFIFSMDHYFTVRKNSGPIESKSDVSRVKNVQVKTSPVYTVVYTIKWWNVRMIAACDVTTTGPPIASAVTLSQGPLIWTYKFNILFSLGRPRDTGSLHHLHPLSYRSRWTCRPTRQRKQTQLHTCSCSGYVQMLQVVSTWRRQ